MARIGGSIERVTDEDRLKGVRGWLLFPPVIVVLHVVTLALAQVSLMWNVPIDDPAYATSIAVFGGLVFAFCGIGVIGTLKLLREKKSARIWLLIYFGLLILLGLDAPLGLMAAPGLDTLMSTLGRFVMPVAVVSYFLVSKRVKLTLVN